ncbi:hypothetical protein DICPUDRAFT_74877 [Dictyostelium purpureum]|uniref:STAS domain-containing protein n=1 Tax=Dictyostelium purpureum TaxID=5786 RepID=F0Z901_DICPU|nr:uncharacterized protein DICPUDRAFT_74877 [Dictyostelium purpureum]EGC39551.1 hypothetical protein DICPUDRAFT_74877 [Dictyostelium purpureum]|eukprot:XP_003283886.1 hypothetical protein DICPUDRAFT_74877 [Dictyostelium purpureum]
MLNSNNINNCDIEMDNNTTSNYYNNNNNGDSDNSSTEGAENNLINQKESNNVVLNMSSNIDKELGISKRFDETMFYFNRLLDIITNEGSNSLNQSINSNILISSGIYNKYNDFNGQSIQNYIDDSFLKEGSETNSVDEEMLTTSVKTPLRNGSEYNDDSLNNNKDIFNIISKLKSETKESLVHLRFKANKDLEISISKEKKPIIIDQIIEFHFENFTNNCYDEIINRFQFQFPNVIDTIKIMRTIPGAKSRAEPAPEEEDKTAKFTSNPENFTKFSMKEFATDSIKSFKIKMVLNYLFSMIQITKWVPKYQLKYIKDDVISSLTVGFMIVPQAMAYAILGGMPPIYGLYAAFIAPVMYGIFGTSNEVSVGPVAMVSLLIPSIISVPSTDPEFLLEVFCLSLLSGIVLIVIGVLRAGFIIENLLSNPILMGFIQAAAFLIVCSQIKNITKIPIPSNVSSLPEFVEAIAEHYKSIHGWTVLFGVSGLVFLIVFRIINNKIKFKVPIAVIILMLSTLISYLINSKSHGISIIGDVPSGLPSFKVPSLTFERAGRLIVGAFIISILGFVESISIAKKFSSIRKYSIDPSQELIALGMCNFVGSFFQACPSTGSFSRTAVNFQTNSRSRVCSIASGVIVACVLLFLTPIIKHTPLCILSAIVIAAAITLFEFKESYELLKSGELLGFIQLIFIFVLTLLFGSEIGIIVAFCVSILQIISHSARPKLVILGRLPGSILFRNIKHFPEAITNSSIKILRYDSRLTYYTVNHFRDALYELKKEDPEFELVQTIIFDMANVSSIDSTAIDVLHEIVDFYKSQNIKILWSDIRPHIQKVMFRCGFLKSMDNHHFFTTTHKALEYALSELQE